MYLKTDEMQMRIGFVGTELIQSEYVLPEEEDYLRAHYLYHNGIWERMEDIEAAQHHQDPDYPVSMWDYELEGMTGWTVEISPLWMKDNVEVTTRGGMTVYRYGYSEDYLKEITKDLGKDEQSNWMVVQALEMTADADGQPVTCTWELRHKAEGTKEQATERLTGQFLPDVDVAGLQEEMCASGPYVRTQRRKYGKKKNNDKVLTVMARRKRKVITPPKRATPAPVPARFAAGHPPILPPAAFSAPASWRCGRWTDNRPGCLR